MYNRLFLIAIYTSCIFLLSFPYGHYCFGQDNIKTAFEGGLNWISENPQRIEEHLGLYANELMFFFLMVEKSTIEKEETLLKKILLERLSQSDGYKFKPPQSVYDTCYYTSIIGYRKWADDWPSKIQKTDTVLLDCIKSDLKKNGERYWHHQPIELNYIAYISEKFTLPIEVNKNQNFQWWLFLGVEDDFEGKENRSKPMNYYDVLKAFYVTHVILIDSDYSLMRLDKHKYTREYNYISDNMQFFMDQKHVDLVAEFAICLNVIERSDSALYKNALTYLIKNQQKDGSWPENIYSYNNKHTTIVALWALKDALVGSE